MSVKQMGKVWDLELPAPQLLVLLALADHADHDGNNVYPSMKLIAWKTGYSERQVNRIVDQLEKNNLIEAVDKPKGKVIVFRLTLDNGKQKEPMSKSLNPKKTTPDTAMSYPPMSKSPTGYDTAMSYEPSLEPSIESSLVQAPDNNDKALAIKAYEECLGLIVPRHALEIAEYLKEGIDVNWIIDAINTATDNNVRKWVYVVKVLEDWKRNGRGKPAPPNGKPPAPDCPHCHGRGFIETPNGMIPCEHERITA